VTGERMLIIEVGVKQGEGEMDCRFSSVFWTK
jgi:hypothetical protein